MQITLKQSDIENALKQYVASQGINTSGTAISVAFTAGRKGAGLSAELTISHTVPTLPVLPTAVITPIAAAVSCEAKEATPVSLFGAS